MALPNFLCVGAQKAGTTTLYEVLKQHPDIYLPEVKEPHFFDEHYTKGVTWYEQTFFKNYQNESAAGEITPAYLYFEEVPQRILETLGPNIKILIIFRNPADRAYSHYLMNKSNGYEAASFEEVMRASQPTAGLTTAEKRMYSYKYRGFYARQLNQYLRLFHKENMHFILFEDLVSDRKEEVYASILDFLQVKNHQLDFNIKSNAAKQVRNPLIQKLMNQSPWLSTLAKKLLPDASKRKAIRKSLKNVNQKPYSGPSNKLSREIREQIIAKYYLEDIKQLEVLINRDLRHWYSGK